MTTIEWADKSWNPVRGCSKVSPGCLNCYAMKQANRMSGPGGAYEGLVKTVEGKGPQWTGHVKTAPNKLIEPLRRKVPTRYFVNSMSDLFHRRVPLFFIHDVFATMAAAHWHQFLVLTKRPERMLATVDGFMHNLLRYDYQLDVGWPLPNVWLGVSAEDQAAADERIPYLLKTPTAVRWLSVEPMLGPVSLKKMGHFGAIDWVVCGGESGPQARHMDPSWAYSLMDECRAAHVRYFQKQMGSVWAKEHGADSVKGGNPAEWPEALRVREYPNLEGRA